jgi:diguanylate cyclase (GGDEF)-like protein
MLENLKVLIKYLEDSGFELMVAQSGEETLKHVERIIPDIILLDVLMPGIDGFETCRRLKENATTQDIPVIFMTALADTVDKVNGFEVGGVDYITKPFQVEEVLVRVDMHLTIHHLQKELEARNRELARLVNIDDLTQIANRRYFGSYLQQEWRRAVRGQHYISLIFIDVDHFKLYNDHYGHQAGDDCLKQVAQVFAQVTQRPADLAARYGGEEFVILLPDTEPEGAEHVAKDIQKALQQLHIPHAQSSVSSSVTCSMGIACMIPSQTADVEAFVTIADNAVYQAKNRGRNQIVVDIVT